MQDPVSLWSTTFEVISIGVFAASGALAAANKRQTLVTFFFFALVTGVGGGTVRDLLIGEPIYWVQHQRVPFVCLVTALLIWFTPRRWWSEKALDWFDAVGLAVYAVFGAAKALDVGVEPLAAAVIGVITACSGGIIRDILAGEPSIILKPELYVTAGALASVSFVALAAAGVAPPVAMAVGVTAGFLLRAWAIWKGVGLPGYRR
jgi:uncharacterized membrane protein YeiH